MVIPMVRIENECVCCQPDLGCIGSACKYKNVPRYYCDICKEEGELFYFDNQELCIECIKKKLDLVEGSDIYTY